MDNAEKASYESAIKRLRVRLDLGEKAIAAQDFQHLVQGDWEPVTEFLRRLEHMFRVAYGRDTMFKET